MKRVFVTGMGIITPLNPFQGVRGFWDGLIKGTNTVRRGMLPLLSFSELVAMARIDDNAFPEPVELTERFDYLCNYAFRMAIKDADINTGIYSEQMGLVAATVVGNVLYKERVLLEKGRLNQDRDQLCYSFKRLYDEYHLKGPFITVSTACSSGNDAIGIATRLLKAGYADIIVAGGVEVINELAIAGFLSLQAITDTLVRPFDRNRNGFAPSEGAAFLVLESEDSMRKRGVMPYAEVVGYGNRADAHHLTAPHREARGLVAAIKKALKDASLSAEDIDYINAHGTATVYNDLMETKAIKKVFGNRAYSVPVSSIKSMLGHSFGAAGVIEAICCVMVLLNNILPPTINLKEPDPECDLDYVPDMARERDTRRVMSLSSGFGGQNSVVILERA